VSTAFGVQLHGTFPMDRYPAIAREVERHPFSELTVHDVVWWRPVWPILTLVAAATERVHVGPDVTHPYLRHPADTAANLAALDELSGGRAVLGLGAGSMLEPLGVERVRPVVAVRECGELVQRLLRGDREPYEGEVFQVAAEARFHWRPPREQVPMFVGAYGPRMVDSVPRWADELRPPGIWAPEFFLDLKRRAERAAHEAGRGDRFRVGCDVWLALDDDRAAARALGRRLLAQFLAWPPLRTMTDFFETDPAELARVRARWQAGDAEGAAEAISDRTLDTFVAAGDARDVVRGLGRLVDAGAATITFSGRLGPDPVKAIRTLGTRVLPELA
jgi:5,10-methylenetetrahydromethanopterin reductase